MTGPSRIWAHGQGTLLADDSTAVEYGLQLELEDAAGTALLAGSRGIRDVASPGDDAFPLSTGASWWL